MSREHRVSLSTIIATVAFAWLLTPARGVVVHWSPGERTGMALEPHWYAAAALALEMATWLVACNAYKDADDGNLRIGLLTATATGLVAVPLLQRLSADILLSFLLAAAFAITARMLVVRHTGVRLRARPRPRSF